MKGVLVHLEKKFIPSGRFHSMSFIPIILWERFSVITKKRLNLEINCKKELLQNLCFRLIQN